MKRRLWASAWLAISTLGLSSLATGQPLIGLDDHITSYQYPGIWKTSGGMSQDGDRILLSDFPGYWYDLTDVEPTPPFSFVDDLGVGSNLLNGISGDGRSVVGVVRHEYLTFPRGEGAIWRRSGEFQRIGFLGDASMLLRWSAANAISQDGSVVVGVASREYDVGVPTIWTQEGSLEALPMGPIAAGPGISSCHATNSESTTTCSGEALGVSRDGKTVVGYFGNVAFKWDAANGTQYLGFGTAPESYIESARDISSDGSTIIGTANIDGIDQAIVWTEASGATALFDLERQLGYAGVPVAVSGDGSVVVGEYFSGHGYPNEAVFIWTRASGIRDLREFLEERGTNTEDWFQFGRAIGISDDGKRIVVLARRQGRTIDHYETVLIDLDEVSTGVGQCSLGSSGCIPVETIARSRQNAHGTFQEFGPFNLLRYLGFERPPVINNRGEVAFETFVGPFRSPDVSSYSARWSIFGPDEEGKTAVKAKGLDLAPGFEDIDVRFSSYPQSPYNMGFRLAGPALNDAGDLLYSAELVGSAIPAGRETGLWRSRKSSRQPERVAQSGDDVPQLPNAVYETFCSWFQIDDSGRAGFMTANTICYGTSTDGSIVFVPNEDGISVPILETNDPAPGLDPDTLFSSAYVQYLNRNGEMALWGYLKGADVDATNDHAIWGTGTDGNLKLVIRKGDAAPGLPDGTIFGGDRDPHYKGNQFSYNDRGQVAFYADLEGPATNPSNANSIWKWWPDGRLELLARNGEQIPGAAPGLNFHYFVEPIMNSRGDVAFLASFGGSSGQPSSPHGYWKLSEDGTATLLLYQGMPAPHLEPGVILGPPYLGQDPFDDHLAGDPVLSESGSTLLDFSLVGDGIDDTNDRALYLVGPNGDPTVVLREGDVIEIAPTDSRTVRGYAVSHGFRSTVGRSPINRRNDVAARVTFTDDSSAIIKLAVPEPSGGLAIALVCLVGLAVSSERRR